MQATFPRWSVCDDHFVSVRPWFHLFDSCRLDSVCWHGKLDFRQQGLRSSHHWPSAFRGPSRRTNRDSSHVSSKVLRKHLTSDFPSASDDI